MPGQVDYNAITAWATLGAAGVALVTALVAVAAIWVESQRSRFAMGISVMLQLDDRFTSEKMGIARRAAAQALLKRPNTNLNRTHEVLDFFDLIALLVSRRAIDEAMVWHAFSVWLCPYWLAARQEHVPTQRKTNPNAWKPLEELYNRLDAISQSKNPNWGCYKTDEYVKWFLEYEERGGTGSLFVSETAAPAEETSP